MASYRFWAFVLVWVLFLPHAVAQNPKDSGVRKHFIVAIDISGSFKKHLARTPQIKTALAQLLQNQQPQDGNHENFQSIHDELTDQSFFLSNEDEITYFQFGLSQNDIRSLYSDRRNTQPSEVIENFTSTFIKKHDYPWRNAYSNGTSIGQYAQNLFSKIPQEDFGRGVSLSNYIYPVAFHEFQPEDYAQEYILIIVSDFLTGSHLGNKDDFKRLQDVYSFGYNRELAQTDAPVIIDQFISRLASGYNPVKYFEYAVESGLNSLKSVGIIAYKVLPKMGRQIPENVSWYVDGNLEIEQKAYLSPKYSISPVQLRFAHNDKVEVQDIQLALSTGGVANPIVLNLASRRNSDWHSEFSIDRNNLGFNDQTLTYQLPRIDSLELGAPPLGDIEFNYEISLLYKPFLEAQTSLKYTLQTTRSVVADAIVYQPNPDNPWRTYGIPIGVGVLVLVLLIALSRPRKLSVWIENPLTDSFEHIDFSGEAKDIKGRHRLPYLRLSPEDKFHAFTINGTLGGGFFVFRWLWIKPVHARISQVKSPHLYLALHDEDEVSASDHDNLKLPVRTGKFNCTLKADLVNTRMDEIPFSKTEFEIEVTYEAGFLFMRKRLRSRTKYKFFLGGDLGNVWVGLDPGTTGSCVAAGADGSDTLLIPNEKNGHDKILPSVITLLTETNPNRLEGSGAIDYKGQKYFYGVDGEQNANRPGAMTFRSTKKLLSNTVMSKSYLYLVKTLLICYAKGYTVS